MRLFLLISLTISYVVCKQCDPETSCDENETCCKLQGDTWGCCPMKSAVCCDDHTHCCPSGTKCDTEGARCVGAFGVERMGKKRPATKTVIRNEFNEIICPDSASKCPDGSTCCMLEIGQYGCCPVPQAVCCPDMLHCCPNGFECHGQFCSQKFAKIPHLRKFPSSSIQRKPAIEFISHVEDEVADDSESNEETNDESEELSDDLRPITCGVGKTCPAKTTCCEIEKNDGDVDYLCCPLSNAVCCQDTCCPSGYHCIRGGKCEKHATSNIESLWNTDNF